MKTKLVLFCLLAVLASLTACRSYPAPGAFIPSTVPGQQTSTIESEEPAAESQIPTISLAEYHAMVSAFNAKVMDESVILIQIGLYEYNWWGSYSGDSSEVDLDAMVELVMGWLYENFDYTADTIADVRGDLMADYAAIVYANVDGEIPAEISDQADALFSAYYQLYATVTEPSGTVRDFVRMLYACTYSITTVNADLASTLEARPMSFCQPEGFPPALLIHNKPFANKQHTGRGRF